MLILLAKILFYPWKLSVCLDLWLNSPISGHFGLNSRFWNHFGLPRKFCPSRDLYMSSVPKVADFYRLICFERVQCGEFYPRYQCGPYLFARSFGIQNGAHLKNLPNDVDNALVADCREWVFRLVQRRQNLLLEWHSWAFFEPSTPAQHSNLVHSIDNLDVYQQEK